MEYSFVSVRRRHCTFSLQGTTSNGETLQSLPSKHHYFISQEHFVKYEGETSSRRERFVSSSRFLPTNLVLKIGVRGLCNVSLECTTISKLFSKTILRLRFGCIGLLVCILKVRSNVEHSIDYDVKSSHDSELSKERIEYTSERS